VPKARPLTERPKWPTAHAKHHDYHLVDPSPWPIVGSISAFIMAVGAITWMHHMFAGGADHVRRRHHRRALHHGELVARRDPRAQYKGDHTRVVQISHRYGMILFIASEVMFFVAWFWAFFNARCSRRCGSRHPPIAI
jgi:cytochrome c oxidase subunit 3